MHGHLGMLYLDVHDPSSLMLPGGLRRLAAQYRRERSKPPSEATGSPLAAIGDDSLPLVSKRLAPTCVEF